MSASYKAMHGDTVDYRTLDPTELERIREIDRTERIEALYVQHGTRLEERIGDFSARAWFLEGDGEHSVAALRGMLEQRIEAGATAVGRLCRPIDSSEWASCCLTSGRAPRSSSPST